MAFPVRKQQVDLQNGLLHLLDGRPVTGTAGIPMTDSALEAFTSQTKERDDSDYWISSPSIDVSKL